MINNVYSNPTGRATYSNRNAVGNSKIPAVPDMITNGQSNLSDSEIKEKIMELARRDVAAGQNSKFTESGKGRSFKVGTDEWRKLIDDYVSKVSPDRKGIITNSLSKLAGGMSSMGINFNRANFFQALFKNNRLFQNNQFGSAAVHGNFVEFYDNGGNEIGKYIEQIGWVPSQTPAEQGRRQDFMIMWDEAMAKAKQELNNPNPTTGIVFSA